MGLLNHEEDAGEHGRASTPKSKRRDRTSPQTLCTLRRTRIAARAPQTTSFSARAQTESEAAHTARGTRVRRPRYRRSGRASQTVAGRAAHRCGRSRDSSRARRRRRGPSRASVWSAHWPGGAKAARSERCCAAWARAVTCAPESACALTTTARTKLSEEIAHEQEGAKRRWRCVRNGTAQS